MPGLSIRKGEWVVVCDGAKALVLENTGDSKFPNLKTVEVFQQEDPPTREQGTDAPGRAFSSVSQGRSSYEQTDWHLQTEQAFLTRLTEHLAAALTNGQMKTKSLIVVAPPRALGFLRTQYSQALKQAVRAEVDKDFVRMPVYEIEKNLSTAA